MESKWKVSCGYLNFSGLWGQRIGRLYSYWKKNVAIEYVDAEEGISHVYVIMEYVWTLKGCFPCILVWQSLRS
jgi:hypothetical protein